MVICKKCQTEGFSSWKTTYELQGSAFEDRIPKHLNYINRMIQTDSHWRKNQL
jgi:hypothetical protein